MIALRTHALARRIGPRARAVHDGLWLGLLSRAGLHALDEAYYATGGSYVDDEHNARGLFPWEEAALAEGFEGCRRVAVLGAGGGREVLALHRRGLSVEGFECNPRLVAHAAGFLARAGCPAAVRALARDAAPAPETPYDGVIVGWSAYMLVPGRAHRIAWLRALRAVVRPGGPLLLSFFTREGDGPYFRTVARVANALRRLRRAPPAEPGDALDPNFVHAFTRDEIAAEMAAGGFALRRFAPQGPGPRDSGWAVGVAEEGPRAPALGMGPPPRLA